MDKIVDLTHLEEMTDNDKVLMKELFEEFDLSGKQTIEQLEESLISGNIETWRSAAHALKGVTLNLGANSLAVLCKIAQERFEDSTAEKAKMLIEIKAAFIQAQDFLKTI